MFTASIKHNNSIGAETPIITIEIFKDGVPNSYKCALPVYDQLTADQKKSLNDFISLITDEAGETDCFSNLTNVPVFDNNSISAELCKNGAYTGFCPCDVDYTTLSVANKKKVDSFVNLVQQLTS